MTNYPPQGLGGAGAAVTTSFPITTVAVDTLLDATHFTVEVDATGGNRLITLPAAAAAFLAGNGRIYNIKKIDATANLAITQAQPGELIDYPGANIRVIDAQNASISIQSNQVRWVVL